MIKGLYKRSNAQHPVQTKNFDGMFERLKDVEVDSFDRDSRLSGSMAGSDRGPGALYDPKNKNLQAFMNDTLSEINDNKEKDVIFNHSMKHGVFNDLRTSPLRNKMPHDLQMYNPALEKRLMARESTALGSGAGPLNASATENGFNKDLMCATSKNLRF